MSKGTLKIANKQYSSMKNDYEMTLNGESSIIPCDDATDLPVALCDFVVISDLESMEKDTVLGEDALSVCLCLCVSGCSNMGKIIITIIVAKILKS